MTKYLISFPSAAMAVSDEELPAVSDASHAVVQEGEGRRRLGVRRRIDGSVPPVRVDGDGTVREGTYPQTTQLEGGYSVLELPSYDAALEWAAKFAVACRARRRCGLSDPTPPARSRRGRWPQNVQLTRPGAALEVEPHPRESVPSF